MHARLTTLQGAPDRVDAAVAKVREDVLPVLRGQDGWKGFTVLADRSSGRLLGISFWDSEETMLASEAAVAGSRERAAEAGGAEDPEVAHFEVVVDETA